MKNLFIMGALILLTTGSAFPQNFSSLPLPATTYIPHYQVQIGMNTTTVLIFPSKIEPGDKGASNHEFLTQLQPGFENILKLKAARKSFISSNLHVFTVDGKVWAFDVSYVENPAQTTFDLTRMNDPLSVKTTPTIITGQALSSDVLTGALQSLEQHRSHHARSSRSDQMKLKLCNIGYRAGYLFFNFKIANHSDLDYPIDFVRAYVKDQGKVKRSSFQNIEIHPIYKDSNSMVGSHSSIHYEMVVPAFTIPDKKTCYVEMYEADGGRNLHLKIKNKLLLHAFKL